MPKSDKIETTNYKTLNNDDDSDSDTADDVSNDNDEDDVMWMDVMMEFHESWPGSKKFEWRWNERVDGWKRISADLGGIEPIRSEMERGGVRVDDGSRSGQIILAVGQGGTRFKGRIKAIRWLQRFFLPLFLFSLSFPWFTMKPELKGPNSRRSQNARQMKTGQNPNDWRAFSRPDSRLEQQMGILQKFCSVVRATNHWKAK